MLSEGRYQPEGKEKEELGALESCLNDLTQLERWIWSELRDGPYKRMVNAQKDLNEYPTLMSHFQKLVTTRNEVLAAVRSNPIIKRLSSYKLDQMPGFSNYCRQRKINLPPQNLNPLKRGQTTFNLPNYLETVSGAKVIISNYINLVKTEHGTVPETKTPALEDDKAPEKNNSSF